MLKGWTLLRIREETKRELERVRTSMEVGESMGLHGFTRDQAGRVGLDQVIMRLIQARDKHAERSRRSRTRRKSKPSTIAGDTDQAGDQTGIESNAPAVAGDAENQTTQGPSEAEIVDPE